MNEIILTRFISQDIEISGDQFAYFQDVIVIDRFALATEQTQIATETFLYYFIFCLVHKICHRSRI